jgi:hypothetical protein
MYRGISTAKGTLVRGRVQVRRRRSARGTAVRLDAAGNRCGAARSVSVGGNSAVVEHEASTSKMWNQILPEGAPAVSAEQAVSMISAAPTREC